jgi:hypothetical protein
MWTGDTVSVTGLAEPKGVAASTSPTDSADAWRDAFGRLF